MLSRQPCFVPLQSPRVEEEGARGNLRGARGDGEGRQACSSASALNPVLPVSIASKRHMRCPLLFPEPFWRRHDLASAAAQIVAEARSFLPLPDAPAERLIKTTSI